MAAAVATSVPVKLLHEAEGHDITIELKSGELYRGRLLASEETMNVQLSSVVHQARDGRVTRQVAELVRAEGQLIATASYPVVWGVPDVC